MGALRSNKPLDCRVGSQGRCFRDDFSESHQQNPVLRISLQSVVQSDLFVPQSTSGRVSQHLLSDVGLPCGCSEFKAFGPATAKKFPHHKRGNGKQPASKRCGQSVRCQWPSASSSQGLYGVMSVACRPSQRRRTVSLFPRDMLGGIKSWARSRAG